jgi:general secretion pathway protein A
MYTSFYQLDSKPFDHGYEQKFYWEGEGQRDALSTMQRGLLHNRKFLFLKGSEGSGKTTLAHALIRGLGNDFTWALVERPSLDRIDFYNDIGEAFGLDQKFTSKVHFLIRFSHFLYRTTEEEKKILLLIDECHQLSQELLEELWLLSNIEKGGARLLNIYFIGHHLFDELLLKPKNNAVRQRITRNVELFPLDVESTGDYVRHRVKAAGGDDTLFGPKAIEAVHRCCRGNMNQINILCDNALSTGSVHDKKTIDQETIEECAFKLGLAGKAAAAGGATPDAAGGGDKAVVEAAAAARGVAESAAGAGMQEESSRGGWLKYAAGIAALGLVGVGLYLYWPGMQARDTSSMSAGNETQVVSAGEDVPVQSPEVASGAEQAVSGPEGNSAQELDPRSPAVAADGGDETAVEQGLDAVAVADSAGPVEQQHTELVERQEDTGAGGAEGGLAAGSDAVLSSDMSEKMPGLTNPAEEPGQPVDAAAAVIAEAAKEAGTAAGMRKEAPAVGNEVAAAPVVPQVEATLEPAEETAREMNPEPAKPMEPSKVVLALLPSSLELTRGGSQEFDRFVETLRAYPRATLLVKGFVSSKTNSAENIKLSEERAMSVQKLLVAKGIGEQRIQVKGMGNQEPIASNDTREGRSKNRRVEIVVVDDGT